MMIRKSIFFGFLIYLAAAGLAFAQLDGENICRNRVREVVQRLYGSCLADLKNEEIKETRKQYLQSLEQVKKEYQQKLTQLKKERDELRQGKLKKSAAQLIQSSGNSTNSTEGLEESNSGSGESFKVILKKADTTNRAKLEGGQEEKSQDSASAQVGVIELDPMAAGGPQELPDPVPTDSQ